MTIDALTTLQTAAAATGNGTAFAVDELDAMVAQVTGTFSATVTWEGTADGTNWVSLAAYNVATGVAAATATAAGIYVLSTVGLSSIRARVSTYASGSVTVQARGDEGAGASVAALVSGASTVTVAATTGTATSTADNTVTNASEEVLPANANRKGAIIQVVSGGNARIRLDGGAASTSNGTQVVAGGPPLVVGMPYCPVAAITAIREGATDAVIHATEIV